MKDLQINLKEITVEELTSKLLNISKKRNWIVGLCIVFVCLIFWISTIVISNINIQNLDIAENLPFPTNAIANISGKMDIISIPTGIVKANPFVPYRNIGDEGDIIKKPALIQDVPKFDLIEPPDTLGENADAIKIMDTVVSGILYDKFSPSAILNINGNDYLVKKGDVVNNYKVLAIAKDSVTVQYGKNTYKAGIGGILTEGKLNHNEVSNINKKFGGEQR